MPQNTAFDSGELRSLAIGYDRLSTPLSPDVRLVAGSNIMVTNKGALNKRPGTVAVANSRSYSGFVDHAIGYETLDSPPRRFIIASVKNGSVYEVDIYSIGGSAPSTAPVVRGINSSITPHEFSISRGLCFIRGSGTSAAFDTLGTVIFNGSAGSAGLVEYWGLVGPATPTAISASGVTSTYSFTVNFGWYYVYTWKTITGQESTRSPLQTDPSKTSSSTGAITSNLCPSVVVQGNSDTTNVPTICIYRSTDGGGNFYKLAEVTNTGSGNITYVDQHFNDGTSTPTQPYPDSALDTTQISPTLTSNSPPPSLAFQDTAQSVLNSAINNSTTAVVTNVTFNGGTSLLPFLSFNFTITVDQEQMKVTALASSTGTTDTWTVVRGVNGTVAAAHASGASVRYTPIVGIDPVQQSTPIANYAGRLWYGINNILFYSGQEEISAGIPEECWPSGLLGNFYRFNFPIVNVVSTSEALYVICTEEVHWLRGSSRDSFQIQKIFSDIGGIIGHPRACTTADKSIVFLTSDMRICIARGFKRDFLSDQLDNDIRSAIQTDGSIIHLVRFAYQEKDLLGVLATNFADTAAKAKQWFYDFNQTDKGLWNVPWSIPSSCMVNAFGSPNGTVGRYLFSMNVNTISSLQTSITYVDFSFTSVQDVLPPGASNYACSFTVSLVRNPTGNHVNMLREPGMVSVLHAIKLDRTAFSSDTDPALTYYIDNSTGSSGTSAATPVIPPRRVQSTGYSTLWYEIDIVCERVSAKFSKSAVNERFECQMIAFVFNPDSGA